MPELPDVTVYVESLDRHAAGHRLESMQVSSPFLVRTFEPSWREAIGKQVVGFRRLGKRIVFEFEDELFFVIHLMIAGRLRWKRAGVKLSPKTGLARFVFDTGTLVLTEAGSKRRASLHVVRGESGLEEHDPGGLDVLQCDLETFQSRLVQKRHTLKRALTDPSIFDGIGNAYSDEILHRASLSPLRRTDQLDDPSKAVLFDAAREVLEEWIDRTRREVGEGFPEKVTAFRKEMVAHGRYGEPCPRCRTPIQRIAYADRETNYCPECQTGGRLLADRVLSRLMKDDWPRSLEELEERKRDATRGDGNP